MNASVTIYTTPYCPFCVRARHLLKQRGVNFHEITVVGRPDLRDWLNDASGQHTVPQIFINGRSVGGFSDIDALDRRGQLDPLLAALPPADLPKLPQ